MPDTYRVGFKSQQLATGSAVFSLTIWLEIVAHLHQAKSTLTSMSSLILIGWVGVNRPKLVRRESHSASYHTFRASTSLFILQYWAEELNQWLYKRPIPILSLFAWPQEDYPAMAFVFVCIIVYLHILHLYALCSLKVVGLVCMCDT